MNKNSHRPIHFSNIMRYATLPNFLTLSRLFLLPLILLFLTTGYVYFALILMFISWLSDALDGLLARKLNQVTEVGKILDHLVDKIWVGSVLVVLVLTRRLPLSITLGVIVRDLLIVIGGCLLIKKGVIPYSNLFGKLSGLFFAILIITYTCSLKTFALPVLWTTWALLVISFISYIPFFIRQKSYAEKTPRGGLGEMEIGEREFKANRI